MDLAGKVAVITGASTGIGAEIARELSKMGVKLVLMARSQDKLEALANELGNSAIVAGDVTDPMMPERLLSKALDAFGQADILVNNAGVMHIGSIDQVDLDTITQMVRINVEAVFRHSYVFLRHFKQIGSGYLINMSSIAGLKSLPTIGAYAGTKFAIEAFTDAIRVEVAGTNIGVAAIEPGTVATNLYDTWNQDNKDYLFAGGALEAQDIARCVRFVLEQPPHVRVPRLFVVPAGQQG